MVSYGIEQLQKSMVKILDSESQRVAGSGFIIRSDGYLITCHHVIYDLASLVIEYQKEKYPAEYCQGLSNWDKDIAILKIELEDAIPVEIINPKKLESSIIVYGFPEAKEYNFPQGFDFAAEKIRPSAPVDIRSTYSSLKLRYENQNSWNRLPEEGATFLPYRINAHVDRGTSGGAVFSEELGGVVGVIQSSKKAESYVIRWDNFLEKLERLDLEPRKNAVCRFLKEIENNFNSIRLFHLPLPQEEKILLQDQYIPIRVTLERKYQHEVESLRSYAESEAESKRAYALKGSGKETKQRSGEETKLTQVDWNEAKKKYQKVKIMVLADPGMGKSTLLKMEAVKVARSEREKKRVETVIFPLLIRLSELGKREEEIIEIIPELVRRDYPKTGFTLEQLLQEKLKTGKCLLLLDALDEVPRAQRPNLQERLNRFVKHNPCPIISTSRIVGYEGGFLDGAKEVEIVPFSQQQREQYIQTWFRNAQGYLEDETVSARGLIEELQQKPQIQELVEKPLLLSLLCSLYQTKGLILPARRTQIYDQAVDYLLSDWSRQRKSLPKGQVKAKVRVLEEIAYHFSSQGQDIFGADELYNQHTYLSNHLKFTAIKEITSQQLGALIDELSEEDGIIQKLSRDGDKYLFLHRTFQEFLTASYLQRVIDIDRDLKLGIVLAKEHVWKYDWHETLILLAGLLSEPIPLLKEIFNKKDDIFKTHLLLAGQCLAECRDFSDRLSTKIIDQIYDFWLRYPNASFITSILVALGKADSDQVVKTLIAALKDSNSLIRESAAKALGEIGNPQAVEPLIAALNDSNSSIRKSAVITALGNIGNPQAVEPLIAALNHSEKDIREKLGETHNGLDVESIIAWSRYESLPARTDAAEALGKIGNAQAVAALIAALNDSDHFVRQTAAEALGKIGNSQAVAALIAALNDSNPSLRESAAMALGKIGNPQAVEPLIAALNDSNPSLRESAAIALGKIGNAQAVEALIAQLNDPSKARKINILSNNLSIRKFGFNALLEALGKIDNGQALEPLIAALNHSNPSLRESAAKALGNIGNAQAVEPLIASLNDSSQNNSKFKIINSKLQSVGACTHH